MEYAFAGIGPALTVVVLIFLILFALVLLGVVVFLAALPGRIARSRQHPQADAVNICGWLGLPTGVLWVLAMVWACYRSDAARDNATVLQQVAALESAVTALESHQKGSA